MLDVSGLGFCFLQDYSLDSFVDIGESKTNGIVMTFLIGSTAYQDAYCIKQ